jgi:hypothetical protein
MKRGARVRTAVLCAFCGWLGCGLLAAPRSVGGTGARGMSTAAAPAQQRPNAAGPATLGLEQGTIDLETPDFTLKLVRASQTVAALQPKGADGFDFTPSDRLASRSADRYHHLGDLTFRLRAGNSGEWQDYDTALARRTVRALPASGDTLASADLTPTLPSSCPLQVTRTWASESGRLVLRFVLKNASSEPVQIGALGIPVVFNNILTGRSLKQAHETCSFFDPYVGLDAGYLQVTRLSGQGPALLVVPDGSPDSNEGPAGTPFEGYMPLNEPTRPNQTFEGVFAWMANTRAYAENEWKAADPWNPPSQATLPPGASRTYGLRFLLSPGMRQLEETLAQNGRPVAVGIPGYVLPMDIEAKLFLKYERGVASVSVEPKDALSVRADKPTRGGWRAYTLRGRAWGRARLTVRYADGTRQSIHYYVTKPAAQAVADLGRFLTTRQWFVDPQDPFRRSPSFMSYDRGADRLVTQDSRVWIAGLGDEAGSGSWLAAAMKEFGQPDAEELAKFEQFMDNVLWGGIQLKDGPNKYGVRKSLFFYDPAEAPGFPYDTSRDWRSWTSWNKRASEDTGRGYNYPHVVAAYWALYRVARNHPGLVKNHPWDWFLDQAYETTRYAFGRYPNGRRRVGYVELGLMGGDVFLALLEDLKREGWQEKAAAVEGLMKERADRWSREEYPFGSEMAWDSTGQEEVYAWCRYFGHEEKARVSLNSILGYMPTLPHWGYNGNARRYWDFLYGGKLTRIERQLHHYGSGLNAIPVLAEYRRRPDDFYLLRVGYGGLMGALTNIDRDGFASAAFHSYPQTLAWDAYSGDYGPNFFGHAFNTGTYLINHPEFGWQAFGGNVKQTGDWVRVRILDSLRKRLFLAPYGLWLTLDAGRLESAEVNTRTGAVRVGLVGATPYESLARLRIEQPPKGSAYGPYRPEQKLTLERGAYVIPLGTRTTWVMLSPAR